MRQILPVCLQILLLAIGASVIQAEEKKLPSPPVGEYGDPAKLVIRGATTIPAEVVKRALLNDVDVLLAGHPRAPLDEYPHTLRRRAVDGYQREGFPKARVSVELDKQQEQIVVTIDEGPQYVCGEVVVEGAREMDADELIALLTQPQPPADAAPGKFDDEGRVTRWVGNNGAIVNLESPVWQRGEPAPFGLPSQFTLSNQVGDALAKLAYESAAFTVRVVPDHAAKTADLRIELSDEGARSRIESIDVSGGVNNSPEAVLEFLELAPGMAYTPGLKNRAANQLWRSARFRKFEIDDERGSNNASVKLRMKLDEYAQAPPLQAEFSQYERVLLRCHEWFAHLSDSEYDLVVEDRSPLDVGGRPLELRLGIVISGRSGTVFSATTADAQAAPPGGDAPENTAHNDVAPDYVLVLTDEQMALHSTARQAKLVSPPPDGFARVEFSFRLSKRDKKNDAKEGDSNQRDAQQNSTEADRSQDEGPNDDDDDDDTASYGFGLQLNSERKDPQQPPFEVALRFEPVAFVALAHLGKPKFNIERGVMTLRTDDGEARFDVESGRLIEYRHLDERNHFIRVTTEKRAFARRLAEIEQAVVLLEDKFNTDRPVTSLAAFLLEDPLLSELLKPASDAENGGDPLGLWRHFVPLMRKLVAGDVLAPLDASLLKPRSKAVGRFRIPWYGPPPGSGGPYALAGHLGLDSADDLFPRDTWAWTVWRETALSLSGQGKYTQQELQRIYLSPETGPLCHLTIASLLDLIRNPMARQFAASGLERLTVVDFRNDYRALLNRRYIAGACLLKAAEVAREMTEEEAESVGRTLLGDDARYFTEAARILRERRDEPVEDVLPEALDALWERGLLPRVSAALRDIQLH